MRKIVILLGAICLQEAYAQQGKVGINTENPKATLDINTTKENENSTSNEGLLIPRLSKARVASMQNPETSTLIYVNDISYTVGNDTNTDNRMEKVDAVGFYHYNGNQWIKHIDTNTDNNEWIYDANTNKIRLKRSGKDNFTNLISYDTTNGMFSNIDDEESSDIAKKIAPIFNSKTVQEVLGEINSQAKNKIKINTSSIKIADFDSTTKPSVWNDFAVNTNEYTSVIDGIDNKATIYSNTALKTHIPTSLQSTGNLKQILGNSNIVSYVSPANNVRSGAKNRDFQVVGYETETVIGSETSVSSLYGGKTHAKTYSKNPLSQLRGHESYVYLRGTGAVTGAHANLSYAVFQNKSTSHVDLLVGHSIFLRNWQNSTPTIKTAQGINIQLFNGKSNEEPTKPTANEYIGIFIDDVKGATKNYAIKTQTGKVLLGDELEIQSSIKLSTNYSSFTITNGSVEPVPTSGAGTIVFQNEHFFGWTGTAWKQLDN